MASASLILIEKLVEDNEIFQYIKPANLKGQEKSKDVPVTRASQGKTFGKKESMIEDDESGEGSDQEMDSSEQNEDSDHQDVDDG